MKTEPNDLAIHITGSQNIKGAGGLTKREHFAAMAMQGLLAHGDADFCIAHKAHIAEIAVSHADALIAALNK